MTWELTLTPTHQTQYQTTYTPYWSGPQVKDSFSYELRCTLVCFSLYYSRCLPGNFSSPINLLLNFALNSILCLLGLVFWNWKFPTNSILLPIFFQSFYFPPPQNNQTLISNYRSDVERNVVGYYRTSNESNVSVDKYTKKKETTRSYELWPSNRMNVFVEFYEH